MITSEAVVPESNAPAGQASPWRRGTKWRFVRASLGSGLLGGICCIGAAVATAAGLGVAGSLTAVMESYQLYFILASVAVMGLWLVRHLRWRAISPLDLRAAARVVGRHALVMGMVYAVTLGVAMGIAQLTTM
jgi:hypothetical protein